MLITDLFRNRYVTPWDPPRKRLSNKGVYWCWKRMTSCSERSQFIENSLVLKNAGSQVGDLGSFLWRFEARMLQFCCTERLSPRDPLPYRTFAACLVKKIHFSSAKVPKFSSIWVKKSREIGDFFEFLNLSDPRPEKPLVFSTKQFSSQSTS